MTWYQCPEAASCAAFLCWHGFLPVTFSVWTVFTTDFSLVFRQTQFQQHRLRTVLSVFMKEAFLLSCCGTKHGSDTVLPRRSSCQLTEFWGMILPVPVIPLPSLPAAACSTCQPSVLFSPPASTFARPDNSLTLYEFWVCLGGACV